MNGFFALLVTLLIAGVMSARERVQVKMGEKIPLLDQKPGFFSRVALYEASIDYKKKEIFNYCSPKEKENGCTNKSSSKFLFDNETASLTPLHGSDGCYIVKIFADPVVEITLIVKPNGLTYSEIIHPKEPPETDDIRWVIGGVIGWVIVGGVIVGVIVFIKRRRKKNKHKTSEAGGVAVDSEKVISGAGEQATDDSFEMVDRIHHLEDEDSLNEVLIDNASVGQESRRPGQLVQHKSYIDDDNNSKNNENDYDDSNYYSNDDSKINDFDDGISNDDDDDDKSIT